jgi:CheY-like chemotaxis protein
MSAKVLSTDDSKTIRMIVTHTLTPYGCTVCGATNGEEGLAAAASERPEIFVDILVKPWND